MFFHLAYLFRICLSGLSAKTYKNGMMCIMPLVLSLLKLSLVIILVVLLILAVLILILAAVLTVFVLAVCIAILTVAGTVIVLVLIFTIIRHIKVLLNGFLVTQVVFVHP